MDVIYIILLAACIVSPERTGAGGHSLRLVHRSAGVHEERGKQEEKHQDS